MYDVFLSGPISDRPKYKEEFAVALCEVRRRFQNAKIWNPAEMPDDRNYQWYMRQRVNALFESSMIYMLPGWRESRGARAEHALAESLRIEVREF
jgi:hypothetical protein